jgi:hypothetical protein
MGLKIDKLHEGKQQGKLAKVFLNGIQQRPT